MFSTFPSVWSQIDNRNCSQSIILNNTHCHLGSTFRLSSEWNFSSGATITTPILERFPEPMRWDEHYGYGPTGNQAQI